MYYIYLYYCNKNLLYIGKTVNSKQRFKAHKSSSHWFKEATHIHIGKCATRADMNIYEIYYINKLKPKYNISSVTNSTPSFMLPELNFKVYTITEFMENIDLQNKQHPSSNLILEYENILLNSIDITNNTLSILDAKNNKFHWSIDKHIIRCIKITNLSLLQDLLNYILKHNLNLNNPLIFYGSYFNRLNKDNNLCISVAFTNLNTITKRQVLFTGSENLTGHICMKDNIVT